MRLSALEKAGIIQVLGGLGELYLCGSRVDDSQAGGDIDLLLIVRGDTPDKRKALLARKHFLLSELKGLIGDQRIDLTLSTSAMISTDPVLQSIRARAIRLN